MRPSHGEAATGEQHATADPFPPSGLRLRPSAGGMLGQEGTKAGPLHGSLEAARAGRAGLFARPLRSAPRSAGDHEARRKKAAGRLSSPARHPRHPQAAQRGRGRRPAQPRGRRRAERFERRAYGLCDGNARASTSRNRRGGTSFRACSRPTACNTAGRATFSRSLPPWKSRRKSTSRRWTTSSLSRSSSPARTRPSP